MTLEIHNWGHGERLTAKGRGEMVQILRKSKMDKKDICLTCILTHQGRVDCHCCMMRRLLQEREKK